MRQIKCRCKATYNNEWRFGSLVIVEGSNHIVEECDLYECGHHIAQESDRPTWVKEETIGQYTGMQDKKGKDVYEGDIVAFLYKGREVKCEIAWCDYTGMWYFKNDSAFLLNRDTIGKSTIIGNIHDNPELLERR